MDINQAILNSIATLKGEAGIWLPVDNGPVELISRCFRLTLEHIFKLDDIKTLFPKLPADFISSCKAQKGVLLQGGSVNATYPTIVIIPPSGVFQNTQLGNVQPNPNPLRSDYVSNSKFSGSISFLCRGRTSQETIILSDIVSLIFCNIFVDVMTALGIKVMRINIGQMVEDKKSNDMVAWNITNNLTVEIPNIGTLYTLTAEIFEDFYMSIE